MAFDVKYVAQWALLPSRFYRDRTLGYSGCLQPLRNALSESSLIAVGAGILGTWTAIKLDITIYDKKREFGGAWLGNQYLGDACGTSAHCYQLYAAGRSSLSSFYTKAPKVLKYWQRVADKCGCRDYMELDYKALEARWRIHLGRRMVKLEMS